MVEGKISLNTKRALLIIAAASLLAFLVVLPAKAGATIVLKGNIEVNKKVDKDGNGYFEGGNITANGLGFRWGLDAETPARYMGSDADDLTLKSYTISEKAVPGYKFVGWYSGSGSCSEPEHTSYPVPVTLNYNNRYEDITLCNKVQPTITVKKQTNPDGDATSFSITATTEDGDVMGDATRSIKDNGSVTYEVSPGTYSVTEVVPAGWTQTSNTCKDMTVGNKPAEQVSAFTSEPNGDVALTAECEIVNTKNATPVVQGAQVVAAPVGGVGAGSGGASVASLGGLLGIAGSLGAIGFGFRQMRKEQ